ncbi:unnamed protein product [Caenorhabditis brenneri]
MSFPILGAPPSVPLIPADVYARYYVDTTPLSRRARLEWPTYSSQVQTHRYDEMPPPPPPEMNLIPRQTREEIPVITELMNTVAEAQSRKRQHEEQEYTGRHFGQQTGMDEDTRLSEEPIISKTKRFRSQKPTPRCVTKTVAENGTNTTPPPSEDSPSTSSPPREPTRPPRFRSPAARAARRARRHQIFQSDLQRIAESSQYLQQVNGLVPSEHNCDPNCVLRQHVGHNMFNQPTTISFHTVPPAVAPNVIQPTVAPIMMEPAALSIYQQYFNFAPMPVLTLPPQPPPLAVPIPIRPAQTYHPYQFPNQTDGFMLDLLRANHSNLYGSTSQYHQIPPQLDRHLFVGIEIDVPIGATRAEIDSNSTMYKYEKTEGDEETCTVCLTDFDTGDDVRKLRCNHMFHPGCIEKWLDINKKCPMCRKEIDKGEGEEPTPPLILGPQPPPIPQLILN